MSAIATKLHEPCVTCGSTGKVSVCKRSRVLRDSYRPSCHGRGFRETSFTLEQVRRLEAEHTALRHPGPLAGLLS